MSKEFDIVFIGSGPAGYTGAIRAGQLGKSVCVIEAGFIGGVCLNRGCIPTKSLLHTSQFFADLKYAEKYGVSIGNSSYDFAKMLELRTNTIERSGGHLKVH